MARQSGPTVGEGDLYYYIDASCYRAIMGCLNDPSNEFYEFFSEWSGMSNSQILAALGEMEYSDPDPNTDKWNLLGGEYGDLMESFIVYGEENGLECEVTNGPLGVITIINSHQGTGGF